jgi:hypothetical protein
MQNENVIDFFDEIKLNITGLEHKLAHKIRLDQEIHNLRNKIKEQISNYVYVTRRELFLSLHKHYTDNHKLDVTSRHYYDDDWFKYTYGSREAQYDKYGRENPYEGPDREVIIVCEQCDKVTRVYINSEKEEVNEREQFDKVLLDDIYKEFIEKHL